MLLDILQHTTAPHNRNYLAQDVSSAMVKKHWLNYTVITNAGSQWLKTFKIYLVLKLTAYHPYLESTLLEQALSGTPLILDWPELVT